MRLSRIAVLLLFVSFQTIQFVFAQDRRNDNATRQLQKFNQFYHYLNAAYIDETALPPLIDKAITTILEELDPHSTYISPEDMESVNIQFDGEFSGIGIEFRVLRDTITITNTITGTPAADAGLLPDDKIVAIDGKNTIGIKSADVPNLLRGKTGTKVDVDILRCGTDTPLRFSIIRDKIPVHTIDASYRIDNHIGYIKIGRFGHTTTSEFADAIKGLTGVDSYIIDLRGNSGGIMTAAIDIAEYFLPLGSTIVSIDGRIVPYKSIKSRIDGPLQNENLVVLIDENSASASEILSGALQDWDRAVIIGRNSFGKGLVQRQFELSDKSAIRITIAKYLTPSGREIQRPYRNGHRGEYYKSYYERILHADSTATDSLSTHRCHTLVMKREIPERQGIVPDIEIPNDTTRYAPYIVDIVRKGVLLEYIYDYLGHNGKRLSREYTSFDSFDGNFMVDERMLSELLHYAERYKINLSGFDTQKSTDFLSIQLKAIVAKRLFTTNEYYKIINSREDYALSKATTILSDWENNGKKIIGR